MNLELKFKTKNIGHSVSYTFSLEFFKWILKNKLISGLKNQIQTQHSQRHCLSRMYIIYSILINIIYNNMYNLFWFDFQFFYQL